MSGVSLPVSRPTGRALVVGNPACRPQPLGIMQRLGFQCAEVDDPYAAMLELSRRQLVYRAMVLSLQSLYREELQLIQTVKHHFPHVEIWLTHTDGRQAALAEAMRLGADGLLADDGLHRTAVAPGAESITLPHPTLEPDAPATPVPDIPELDASLGEPVLTADELRALLQESPTPQPGSPARGD